MGIIRIFLCGYLLLGFIIDVFNLFVSILLEIWMGIEFGVFFFNICDNIDGRWRVIYFVIIGIKIVRCFVFDFVFDSIRYEIDYVGVV